MTETEQKLREAAHKVLASGMGTKHRPYRDFDPVLREVLEEMRAVLALPPEAAPAAPVQGDALDAAQYRALRDWLQYQGQLVCVDCQPGPDEPSGLYWVLRGCYLVKGGNPAGYGKTEDAAIAAAMPTSTKELT